MNSTVHNCLNIIRKKLNPEQRENSSVGENIENYPEQGDENTGRDTGEIEAEIIETG